MDITPFLMPHAGLTWDEIYNNFVKTIVPAMGGEIQDVDNPLIWVNGSGQSHATVIKFSGLKFVILSVAGFNAQVAAQKGGLAAKLPLNFAPDGSKNRQFVRMTLTPQAMLVANGETDVAVWTSTKDLSNNDNTYGSVLYLAKTDE